MPGERPREHWGTLTEFRAALNSAETEEHVAAAFLGPSNASVVADAVSLGVLDREAGTLRVTFVGDIPAEHRDRFYVVSADGPGPMAETARTERPIVVEDAAQGADRHQSVFQSFGDLLGAYVFHPLHDSAGALIGVITLAWFAPRSFAPAELETTAHACAIAGPALARVRAADRERHISEELQAHLLDLDRSSLAAVVAAVYRPAAEAMRVGGDWYLVAPCRDPDSVAVCVGDVVGMGLAAATVMTRLRSAIAAASATLSCPAEVLSFVERYARTMRGMRCSTVAYAVLDGAAGSVRYVGAGHPYPLVVEPDGRTRYLEGGRRPALAATAEPAAQEPAVADLPPGSLLILYTDGLIERRGESLDTGMARLAAAAAKCAGLSAGEVCDELLERLTPPGGYTDDVAILAVRPVGVAPGSFVAVLPADVFAMAGLRERLRPWLEQACPDPNARHDALLTVGEALSNAIEHGSQAAPDGTVSVELFANPTGVRATVNDGGRWSGDSSASRRDTARGRGLTLIHALSTHAQTARTAHGTRVTVHHEWAGGEPGR
ncbi:MAG: ATP-binding SpoIIE family protein phosphatase [Sporichthyaceae bacterium]